MNLEEAIRSYLPRDSLFPSMRRLLRSFESRGNPALVLAPYKTDQLVRLSTIATHSDVEGDDTLMIIPRNPTVKPTVSGPLDDNDAAGSWHALADDTRNPLVSFLVLCVFSSLYVLERDPIEQTTVGTIVNSDTFIDIKPWWTIYPQARCDPLLFHFEIVRMCKEMPIACFFSSMPSSAMRAFQETPFLPMNTSGCPSSTVSATVWSSAIIRTSFLIMGALSYGEHFP
jgi:hypothetical protein